MQNKYLISKKIFKEIDKKRKEKEISIENFCDTCKISRSQYYRYLSGETSLSIENIVFFSKMLNFKLHIYFEN